MRTTKQTNKIARNDATVQAIVQEVLTNDAALVKAVDILFSKQTVDERVERTSKYHNMQGLRWAHGKVMADIAVSLYTTGALTQGQKDWLRGKRTEKSTPRIAIYWRQLAANWARA